MASALSVLARGTGNTSEVNTTFSAALVIPVMPGATDVPLFGTEAGLKGLSFKKVNECVGEEAKPVSMPDVEAEAGRAVAETIVSLPIMGFSFLGDEAVTGAGMVAVGAEGVAAALLSGCMNTDAALCALFQSALSYNLSLLE